MQITLRPGVAEDRDFLWWLHGETMRDFVDETWGWDERFQRQRFDETFAPEALLIVEKDGAPIGYISVRRTGNEIYLAGIEIAPAQQRRGIASWLIEKLFQESDESRLPLELQVLKMSPVRKLYERLGFQCRHETSTHFLMRRNPSPAAAGEYK